MLNWTVDCIGVLHRYSLHRVQGLTQDIDKTRSPASAGIANRPLVFLGGHNIEYLCLNLFTLRRFNNNENSGGRQIRYGATGVMPPD